MTITQAITRVHCPHHLPQAFGEQAEIYMQRIEALKQTLLNGRLHKAKQLCLLDFEPG